MKTRLLLLASVCLLVSTAGIRAETPPPAATDAPLYVTISALEPIDFRHYRHGHADGKELILSTLKMNADRQARFAGYPGDVVVLDEDSEPPAGSPTLRLTWTADAVMAELFSEPGSKPVNLGVVSRTPLSDHPDFKRMRQEIDQSGSSDRQRDATLRAQTQMNLYLALVRAKRDLPD